MNSISEKSNWIWWHRLQICPIFLNLRDQVRSLMVVHMNLTWLICNERNYSIFYTIAKYEVHTFKNVDKIKIIRRHFCLLFPLILSIYSQLQICYNRNTRLCHSTWWERDELINHSKYITGSGVILTWSIESLLAFALEIMLSPLKWRMKHLRNR